MTHQRALIFDLDGTLVDSLDDITFALNQALTALHRSDVSRDNVRSWIGDGLPTLCRCALGENASSKDVDALTALARKTYDACCTKTTALYPKILKTLELLKVGAVPLAVLTNKPQSMMSRILDHLQLAHFFHSTRGYLTEEDKKPAPKPALEIARGMDIDPGQICIVGDSIIDVQTARNAGMKAAAVTWGYQDRHVLEAAAPDHLIDDPEEILSLLNF